MKVKHIYSRFNFTGDDSEDYNVLIAASKRGENVFKVYKNGKLLNSYEPKGLHVSKTSALFFLKKAIAEIKAE